MRKVGGNQIAVFKGLSVTTNAIGERVQKYVELASHTGWLDYSSGSAGYEKYKARIEESTHVFVCDWFDIDPNTVKHLTVGSREFDVLYFDRPMDLGSQYHFEVFLKEVV